MIPISLKLPQQLLKELDRLVQEGKFANRSEAIRVAVRDLILRESGQLICVPKGSDSSRGGENEDRIVVVPGR